MNDIITTLEDKPTQEKEFVAKKYKKKLHIYDTEQGNKPSEFYLKPPEINKLIYSAQNPRDRCIIKTLAYTGMRRDELRNILCANIDWDGKTIFIKGKFGKTRLVDIPDSLVSDLKFFLCDRIEGYLFTNNKGKPMSNMHINRIVAEVGKKAGIKNPDNKKKNINPHIFRHSFTRNARAKGVEWEKIQKLLGHKSIRTTIDIYGGPDRASVSETYHEKLENLYEDVTKNGNTKN